MKPVILDTDLGTDIDDTWALQMLLGCPELDLRLIVTATADTRGRAEITQRFLGTQGRSVPVAMGVPTRDEIPLVQGAYRAEIPVEVREDGIDAMIELIRASEEPVTLIAIGPCPNIAVLIERAPDLIPKVDFVGMHGSFFKQYGDEDGTCPETNIVVDVPAARATFAAPWRSVLITPLDTCGAVVLRGERYQRLRANPKLAPLMENYDLWFANTHRPEWCDPATQSSCLFDTVAVYLAYAEEFLEIEDVRFSITDDGLTVLDPNGYPARVAMRWRDLEAFEAHLEARLVASTEQRAD